jgi:S1-C subfamily serine protease
MQHRSFESVQAQVRRRHWLLLAAAALAGGAGAAEDGGTEAALKRAFRSVVGLQADAVDGARSAQTLGARRQGSGVVIGDDGLVLTIGYLVLEADQVELTTADDRRIPARVLAYDVASGFGLVQALVPLRVEAAPLGRAQGLAEQEVLVFARGGDAAGAAPTRLVARRAFTGYWEYHLDDALFTVPPWPLHSGAGLFNQRGELVGIGSLVVADAGRVDGVRQPGNMFVPIDLLLPVLDEMRRLGTSAASHRAWLGLNCVEAEGAVRVARVTPESPAATAGLRPGDQILRIDDEEVRAVEGLWRALWRGGTERAVKLEIQRGAERRVLTAFSVDRMKTLKRPAGI